MEITGFGEGTRGCRLSGMSHAQNVPEEESSCSRNLLLLLCPLTQWAEPWPFEQKKAETEAFAWAPSSQTLTASCPKCCCIKLRKHSPHLFLLSFLLLMPQFRPWASSVSLPSALTAHGLVSPPHGLPAPGEQRPCLTHLHVPGV